MRSPFFDRPSPSLLLISTVIALSIALCAATGMVINPQSFVKFFFLPAVSPLPDFTRLVSTSYSWDVTAYSYMALKDMCIAFYPLWPWLMKILFQPQSIEQAAWQFRIVASGLSFAAIPLFLWILQQGLQRRFLAFLIALLYFVSPMSIFRFNGYAESLFAFLSLLLLGTLLPENALPARIKLIIITGLGCLLGLTRAVMVQNVASAIAALITIAGFAALQTQDFNWGQMTRQIMNLVTYRYRHLTQTTIALSLGTICGYSLYGIQCLSLRGDFFTPFKDQELWRKSLGLRLDLLLLPKSFLIDLLGLYCPILLFLVAVLLVYSKITPKPLRLFMPRSPWWTCLWVYPPLFILVYLAKVGWLKVNGDLARQSDLNANPKGLNSGLTELQTTDFTQTLSENYGFWFSIYFSLSHAVSVFLTQDRMISLGRYIFAPPFVFVAIGYLCCCIPNRAPNVVLLWIAAISAIYLVVQWVNYGYGAFLG
jgi:hypothetical protein